MKTFVSGSTLRDKKIPKSEVTAFPATTLLNDLDENLQSAAAIVDCIRVLSVLERMDEFTTPANLTCGAGWANGEQVSRDSLPLALAQALKLMDAARGQAKTLTSIVGKVIQ